MFYSSLFSEYIHLQLIATIGRVRHAEQHILNGAFMSEDGTEKGRKVSLVI